MQEGMKESWYKVRKVNPHNQGDLEGLGLVVQNLIFRMLALIFRHYLLHLGHNSHVIEREREAVELFFIL